MVIDASRRCVQHQGMELEEGHNDLNLNVSTLAAGAYHLVLTTADGACRSLKFVKAY